MPAFQQPAKNGPEPGEANRLSSRRRRLIVAAATASRKLIAGAGLFVIVISRCATRTAPRTATRPLYASVVPARRRSIRL